MMRSLSSKCARTLFCAGSLVGPTVAQIGGNGSDGVFAPTVDVVLPTNRGAYNFQSITIPAGVTVTLQGSQPALVYSQGQVSIDGVLHAGGGHAVSGTPGSGGPGGFAGGPPMLAGAGPGGGVGGYFQTSLLSTNGSGGGHATPGGPGRLVRGGSAYGTDLPFELVGGSGGGGGAFAAAGAGGGGGGVLVVLSDGPVTIRGTVSARGGDPWAYPGYEGGGGAGGSILVRSVLMVTVASSATVDARGGVASAAGGDGFVRLDAFGGAPQVAGSVTPAPRLLALPDLRATNTPVVGGTWRLQALTAPNDRAMLFLSAGLVSIPFPPFGTLRLDPVAGIVLVAAATAPAGIDPIAGLAVPIPGDPRLVGLTFHGQAVNLLTTLPTPRFTGVVSGTIR